MSTEAGRANRKAAALRSALVVLSFTFAAASICAAQYNGSRPGGSAPVPHFSGPPIPTGAPPVPGYNPGYSYHYHYGPYFNGSYGGGRGSRGGGWAYVVPYYYPADDSAYGYDYVGAGEGPDLYSGPPVGPNDPTLHMIVEQPPVDPYSYGPPPGYAAAQPPAAPAPAPAPSVNNDVKPGEPTVLVFRNGKQQEVTNYAIMGDTLYVFDGGKKKIALADLDIPATVKANDDRGMEFKVPPSQKKKATTPAPQSAKPDGTSDGTPPNIAAVIQ
jgi:hypothetical protein